MTPQKPLPRMLRVATVAALAGVSTSTLYRLAATGEMPPLRKIGMRASGFREDEIRAWLESRPASAGAAA